MFSTRLESFAGPLSSGQTVGVAIDAGFIQSLLDSSSGIAGFAVRGVGTPGNASIFSFWGTSSAQPSRGSTTRARVADSVRAGGAGARYVVATD
jgi:hypothetical protein